MERQRKIINSLLRQIYQTQKEKEKKDAEKGDNVVIMLEKYNKNNEYFYIEIYLLEKIPKFNNALIYHNTMFPHLSPQEIYLGCLKGEKFFIKCKELIEFQNKNIDMQKMVTPNLNKSLWYLESDLVQHRLIKVFCKMNLINMKNMLKSCPIPNICFYPSKYKLNDPKKFVEIINNIKDKKILNFIPYIREYSIRNKIINDKSIYQLFDNIKLVDQKCLQ